MLNQKINLPPDLKNYTETLYWKMTDSTSQIIILNLFSLVSFIIFGWLFWFAARTIGNIPSAFSFDWLGMMVLSLSIVFTLLLHECIHAVCMIIVGANPKFGIIFPIALYTTSPGFAYKRNNYLVMCLAPFVVISFLYVISVVLLNGNSLLFVFLICATINASGAVGDFWIAQKVLSYPGDALIIDEKDGIRVLIPKT